MQHAGADEEHRYYLSCPHHPQRLEGGLSAGLGEVAGRGDWGGMSVAVFFHFLSLLTHFSL